jgi:DUF4097 and DUF4098 domain-containing protein YvlB
MRTEKKIAIIIAVILVVFGVGMATVSMVSVAGDFKKVIKNNANYVEKTYDVTEDFDFIDFSISSDDIRFEKSSDNNTHFTCKEAEDIKYVVKVDGKTLKIKQEENNRLYLNFGINNEDTTAVLYLPKDSYEKLSGKTGSGDINLNESFSFSEISLEVGSGDISLSDVKCKFILYAKTSSGDIETKNVTSEGSFSATTGSGNVKLENSNGANVAIKTGPGNVKLKAFDGTSIGITTGSGDVEGTLRSAKQFDAKASSGDVNVTGYGDGGTCTVRTGSGDITLSVLE